MLLGDQAYGNGSDDRDVHHSRSVGQIDDVEFDHGQARGSQRVQAGSGAQRRLLAIREERRG